MINHQIVQTRWDWYQSTVYDYSPVHLARRLQGHFPSSDIAPSKPKNGYERAIAIRRGDTKLCEMWHGGNPGCHLIATGENSPELARFLAGESEHFPSRVDGCMDWDDPDIFDRFAKVMLRYATERKLDINQQGDWHNGKARTLYVGSRNSAVRLVLYEKGFQPDCNHRPNWVRLEVRVRPSKKRKPIVSKWEPWQSFTASKWVVKVLEEMKIGKFRPEPVGTVRSRTPEDMQLEYLIKAYYPTLERLFENNERDPQRMWENIVSKRQELQQRNELIERLRGPVSDDQKTHTTVKVPG